MNKKVFTILGVAVVVFGLVSMSLVGCAKPVPPAAKPDKFICYHSGDLSGAYAPITAPLVGGFNDALEWLNEQGGIAGVPVEQVFRDTGGKLDAGLAAYAAFKEMKPYPVVIFVYQSADTEALHDRFIEDKILCISASSSPESIYPPGYTIAFIPGYSDLCGLFIDWVSQDWAKKAGQKVKLAILTWDHPFGKAIMVPEVRAYAAKKGVEIVYEGVYGVRDLDVSTQMTAIRAAGANWVYGNTTSHGHKVRAVAAKALGILATDLYDTTPGKIHFSGGPYDTDESTMMMSGEVMEGYAGSRAFASTVEETQGMKLLSASADKHGRKPNERIGGYIASWCNVYATAYAVDKVVKKSGWGSVNGTTVRDEFLKFRDLDIMGLAKWEFTPDKPEGKYGGIYQVKGGKLLPITGWVTCPDLKPAKYKK